MSGPQHVALEGGTSECFVVPVDTATASTSVASLGPIIGGVLGGVLGLCLVVTAFILYRRRSRKRRAAERKKLTNIVAGGAYKFQDSPRDSDLDHIPLSPLSEGNNAGRSQ